MNISRRLFLGGFLSIVGASAYTGPILAAKPIPKIYADGDRDDTDGLVAFFSGEPFTVDGQNITADNGVLRNGIVRVKGTISVPSYGFLIDDVTVFGDNDHRGFDVRRERASVSPYDYDMARYLRGRNLEDWENYIQMTEHSKIRSLVISASASASSERSLKFPRGRNALRGAA